MMRSIENSPFTILNSELLTLFSDSISIFLYPSLFHLPRFKRLPVLARVLKAQPVLVLAKTPNSMPKNLS